MSSDGQSRISVQTAAREIFEALESHHKITFFCGAGISMAAPSLAPDWKMLRDALFASLLDILCRKRLIAQEQKDHFIETVRHFELENGETIKPEIALHWLHLHLGDRFLESLSILDTGSPNDNHHTIAHLLKHYPDVAFVTVNFDQYVELALETMGIPFGVYASIESQPRSLPFSEFWRHGDHVPIAKLHGTISQPETIKATLRAVSTPMSPSAKELLRSLIHERYVFIIGYSGNDYDIFPELSRQFTSACKVY